jgi:hypothetical protein
MIEAECTLQHKRQNTLVFLQPCQQYDLASKYCSIEFGDVGSTICQAAQIISIAYNAIFL